MTRSSDLVMVEREVLERSLDAFEFIRIRLINNLAEPERTAFWKAVQARDDLSAALQPVEGGVQGSIATKQESCPEGAPRTETAIVDTVLSRAAEALKEFIVSASFASRAALDSDTIFCEIYTPGYSPAKKGSFGFFVKELRAILSLLSGAGMKSAPLIGTPHNSGERLPIDKAESGADTKSDGGVEGNAISGTGPALEQSRQPETPSAGIKPGPSDAKLAIAVSALEFVRDGYGDQDVNHVDYRVRVYEVALDALAQLTKTPSADHDDGNLRGAGLSPRDGFSYPAPSSVEER